jgi:hypothetical protein
MYDLDLNSLLDRSVITDDYSMRGIARRCVTKRNIHSGIDEESNTSLWLVSCNYTADMRPRSGDVFSLNEQVVAAVPQGEHLKAFLLPAGSTVRILTYPSNVDERMADADAEGRKVLVFGFDLERRAVNITIQTENARQMHAAGI